MYNTKRSKVRKRKTRKCLDEMRKKSLSLETANGSKSHSAKNTGKSNSLPKNITSDRLSMKLGMFAKGVRSSTITRPTHISEEFKARMDQNLHKIIDLANGKPSHTTTSDDYRELFKEIRNKNWLEDGDVEVIIEDDMESIAQQNRRNDAPVYTQPPTRLSANCTPPNQVKLMECLAHKELAEQQIYPEEEANSIKDSQESPYKCDNKEYRQFDEHYRHFIEEEIPAYLSENVTRLLNDDTINRTKTFLQDVCKKNCNSDSDSILNSPPQKKRQTSDIIEQTIKESILLNPIEYMRQNAKHENSYISSLDPKRTANPQNVFVPKTNFSANLTWNGTQYVDSLTWSEIPNYAITENILEESEEEVVNLKISLTPEELTQSWKASSSSDDSCDAASYKEPSLFYCFPRKLNP